jgi:hypothetical protein
MISRKIPNVLTSDPEWRDVKKGFGAIYWPAGGKN